MRRLLLLGITLEVLVLSCDSSSCPGWAVPEKRKFEVMAIARHEQCIKDLGFNCTPDTVGACHAASEGHCVDAGYAKTCGNGEREGMCGDVR